MPFHHESAKRRIEIFCSLNIHIESIGSPLARMMLRGNDTHAGHDVMIKGGWKAKRDTDEPASFWSSGTRSMLSMKWRICDIDWA